MAKRVRPASIDAYQIRDIRKHLDEQDLKYEAQKRSLEGLNQTLQEVLTILRGSKAMGVVGIRESVLNLKKEVLDLDSALRSSSRDLDKKFSDTSAELDRKIGKIDGAVQQIKENEGKFTFSWADVRTKIVGIFLFIGSVLSIILAVKQIFFSSK